MKKVTIAYVTSRRVPRWEWFVESLVRQASVIPLAEIQVVFVDGHLWAPEGIDAMGEPEIDIADGSCHDEQRREALITLVDGRFDFLHIPPKPYQLQGPFRQTQKDYFCAANSRNTAIIAAKHPYFACVDDLSVLMPGWLDQLAHAAEHGYCVCGAYKKVLELVVEQGEVVSYRPFPEGVDSRWSSGSDTGIVPWMGTALYGCSFGAPLESILKIDGFEPAANGQGGEDYDFGIRLERGGVKVFYNRNMLTLESEEDHHTEATLPRERRLVTAQNLPPGYAKYQAHNREEMLFSDHVLLNRVINETKRIVPLYPEGLRALRDRFLATRMMPIPAAGIHDWRDGTPLSEL